ncbi:Receptor-like protein kinase [Camellia lanceoleosa]|uniref:Receptor-like protein kinase n=1 Tax=Camellia lanceoleosa TaxID=1840588 RepID=A0ACC0GDU7_9ERIC|nr:Receptor-like protein kinase [Camellia lanceoleosa]
MTTLVTLDLSTLYFPGAPSLKLENPNLLKLVQNLTGLKTLILDGVNMSAQASQWCEAISSSLPNLRVLSLSNCNLSGPIDSSLQKLQFLSDIRLGKNNLSALVPEFFADFPNLRSLLLCFSNLYGNFPEKIFEVSTLEALDLSGNSYLQGVLPQFPPNGSLHTLVLGNTNFSGTLPDSVGNLKMLSRIELPDCNFNGTIPNTMAKLTQLVHLDLSSNSFTGTIPSFQASKNIKYIDLSHNALTGLGFGIGAGVIIGPLMFWKQGSKWCNKHIERFAKMILPSLGFIFAWCDYVKVEPTGNIEEETQDDKEDSDEDEDEDTREDKAFSRRYCVFCSKLDIHVKKGIHNPKCNCHHDSPSISSLSLSPPPS